MGLPVTPLSSVISSQSQVDTVRDAVAHLDLPSPACDDISLITPSIEHTIAPGSDLEPSWIAPTAKPVLAAPEPVEVAFDQVATPAQEYAPSAPLDVIVGAAIDPAPAHEPSLPAPAIPRAGRGLRLPSFDLLGIANPRPDRIKDWTVPSASPSSLGCDDVGAAIAPGGLFSGVPYSGADSSESESAEDDSPRAHSKVALHQFVTTLTPPAEGGGPVWESIATIGTGLIDSPSITESGSAARTPSGEASSQTSAATTATATQSSLAAPRIQVQRTDSDTQRSAWLDEATDITISAVQTARNTNGPIRVLSHALPSPSITGFAFPKVISSLHNNMPGSNTCWINVFHALHGRYNLADLPTSPPGTPGPAVGGDDYFATKVFDSAVPVLDYQENLTTMPRTPHPVVPPSSINLSIVERYIPPTSQNEFAEMFDLKGRSLLVDRMVELSPDHGTLLFVYPTKRGAQTFTRDYLSPVLDPLLRSMCIINELSVDLGSAIGRMRAVDTMPTFDTLTRKMQQLCRDLSQDGNSLSRFSRGTRPTFSLQSATREEVMLERKVWAENWWVKQEKPRVREELSKYFRIARKLPVDSDVTPTNLIHEVLDGVTSRPYRSGDEPSCGVEVAIFVITRTS